MSQHLPPKLIAANHLIVDITARRIVCCQQEISLSPLQFDLLVYLVQNGNRFCTFYELMTQVWQCQTYDKDEHVVRLAISKLRKKFSHCPNQEAPLTLRTVRGRGYCFDRKPFMEAKRYKTETK